MKQPAARPTTWSAVFEHFHRAADLSGTARANYLNRPEITADARQQIQSLLDADQQFQTETLANKGLDTFGVSSEKSDRSGERLLGFELLNLIGAGSAGQVYRARDLRLGRLVALKLTHDTVTEARVMALLEHPHIVAVYGVAEAAASNLNMICMQFVQGISLAQLMQALKSAAAEVETAALPAGQKVLTLIDFVARADAPPLDPSRIEEKLRFARLDAKGIVAKIASELCRALAFAHTRGILHLDIKPANILIDHTGRALLADFGISLELTGGVRHVDASMPMGGTFGYMAPEHRDAFIGERVTLGPPADVFALGVVCRELAQALAVEDEASKALWDKACDPDLGVRLPDVPAFAGRVAAWAKVTGAERAMPLPAWLQKVAAQPWAASEIFLILANIVASALQIAYNKVHIIDSLSVEQKRLFVEIVPPWNMLAFAVAYVLIKKSRTPVRNAWLRAAELSAPEAEDLCEKTLKLANRHALIVAIFWCIGFTLFTVALVGSGDPLPPRAIAHFFASFLLSAGIAWTYTKLGADIAMIRCVYPRFLARVSHVENVVARDFALSDQDQRRLRLATGAIPLAAAALIVGSGLSAEGRAAYDAAIVLLIVLGVAGFGGASRLLDGLKAWIAALRA